MDEAELEREILQLHDESKGHHDQIEQITNKRCRLIEELRQLRMHRRKNAIEEEVQIVLQEPRSKTVVVQLCRLFIKYLGFGEFYDPIKVGTKYSTFTLKHRDFRVDYQGNVRLGKTSKRIRLNICIDPPASWTTVFEENR